VFGLTPGKIDLQAAAQGRICVEANPLYVMFEVLELQPAGKKRMTAEEFLRGYPIQDGYRFGPERLP
jgi:methionyl-tRNA formyltransferase